MPTYETHEYRPNVCAVIKHRYDDRLLFCHRKGFNQDEGWQFPQGGYNPELDIIDEMKRELREEIGTDDVAILEVSNEEYYYDFPIDCYRKKGGFRGQRQTWVLCHLLADESLIDVATEEPEFDLWRWVTPQEALNLIVDFKRSCYEGALKALKLID